ncbi:sirohydrochlorin chelatase [Oceanisphaera avium]|uniref:Cobalamin biosynthesis protein CbiX n=1 Tax=Oceanisphaera avium TaxID=1903694 RepID=A0A1Y0D076_9GAMM|nr:CbiX/SirB N-terminal domain-containing protein [Oceanisphaera avium]ART80988.1 cobalamin biosynthesis protein CbiX [Oceanisphaera avium]
MKGFILVAHGSRRELANQEIADFSASVTHALGERFDIMGHAFWELAEPSLAQAIDSQVAAGASDIKIFPYFLAQGRHVVEDLPSVVHEKREQYPQLTLTLLPHLGALPNFAKWLAEQL